MWLNQYICDVLVSFELRRCFKLIVKLWLLTYGFIDPFKIKITPEQRINLGDIVSFFPKLKFSFKDSYCVMRNISKRNRAINHDVSDRNKKVYCWLLDVEYQQEMNQLLVLKVSDYRVIRKLNYIPNLFFYK